MSVYKTAYDTIACKEFVLTKITHGLKQANVNGQLTAVSRIFTVEGGSAQVDAIPSFAHPVLINEENIYALAIDVRTFGKFDQHQQHFVIRNLTEYNLAVYRAKLNYIWIEDSTTLLRDISPVCMGLFSSWISEAVAKRFALNPREQLDLSILAAVYYNSLFHDKDELEENDKVRLATTIGKAVKSSAQDVFNIVDKISVIHTVRDFCTTAGAVTGSIRLHELNTGVLFAIMGGTWFGTNSREMVAVALEHPPTWIAILLSAYTERSFSASPIGKLCERGSNKDAGKNFVLAVQNLLKRIDN